MRGWETMMNPDLYACLPPDKKEEYKKLFPEPTIDYAMPTICIDDCVPCGYAFLGDQVFKLPGNQTCTSEESKPLDLVEMQSIFEKWKKMESDIIDGSYILKLADEIHKELMRKEIEEDFKRRLKEATDREIMKFWIG